MKSKFGAFTLIELLVVIAVLAAPARAMTKQIMLGPPDPGAEHGFDSWYHGMNGEAWVSVDDTDPATGEHDFILGNKTAGDQNRADWRSRIFPLGPAAKGARPITFSFACKFPGKINGREDMQVYLRFYDAAGTNFLGQKIFRVGFNTGSSNMSNYKTMTFTDIRAPKRARMADVWVTANIFVPWTSGSGQFDDFSVTTVSRLGLTLLVVFAGLGIMLIIITITVVKSQRTNRGNVSYYPYRKR
ncbi:MAG: prepilin-type N-terminal cleavage/methylation domain-containing protein [Verrucomicrobiota bacterium]